VLAAHALAGNCCSPGGTTVTSELEEISSSLASGTIQQELRELVDCGVVEKMNEDGTGRYRLTDDRRDGLEGTGLFNAGATLKYYYNRTG
jgi:DNA-binding transcriptional ArsR family regulator